MPYSDQLAETVRLALAHIEEVEEKKMFGGLAFMVNGKMCINAGENRLMFRIDPALQEQALSRKGCSSVIMQGRVYKGFVYVNTEGLSTKEDFDYWVALALDYNKTAKASKKRRRKK